MPVSIEVPGFDRRDGGDANVMLKLLRRVTRPFSRALLLGLVWNHRQVVALWARTFIAEIRDRRRVEFSRLRRLGSALSRVSTATSREDLAGLRRLRLVDPDSIVVEGEGLGVDIAMTVLGGSIMHVHAA